MSGYDTAMHVVLASKSPRRLMLLQSAGLAVEVCPSHVDESQRCGESVHELVARLCRDKAQACKEDVHPVIAADTLVARDDSILGQPGNLEEAAAMLHALSGAEHRVFTGICVRLGMLVEQQTVQTKVRFRSLDSQEIATYLAHNEVLDKAGAYAIQGGAASFIEAIEGPLDNVIGLPVKMTLSMLNRLTNPRTHPAREKAA
ncbi:MAG: Maf family protein [Mariprofundaceae bacterium]